MQKSTKRILSLVETIVLVLTMVPVQPIQVFAWEEKTSDVTFGEADTSVKPEILMPTENTMPFQLEATTTAPTQAEKVEQEETIPIEYPETSASVEGYYTYTVSDGTATITEVDQSISGHVTIPSTLGGCPVTIIGSNAFYCCSDITSLTIADGVTTIGSYAFGDCVNIYNVVFPDSMIEIGSSAFCGCDSLYSVTIPDSVTTIESAAFYDCDSLYRVQIGKGARYIDAWAFWESDSLEEICVDSQNPFYCNDYWGVLFDKNKTTLIAVPNGIYSSYGIPDREYVIPYGVRTIQDHAFMECDSLTSVTIPDSVTSIGEGLFEDCDDLNSVKIGNGLTNISKEMFYNCDSLTSVTIPDSVISIGQEAFYSCDNLISATIGNGLTQIDKGAFYDCDSLTAVTIPDSVISIGQESFYSCDNLISVTIGNGLTKINQNTFYGCKSLADLKIGNKVTTIGDSAFFDCVSLVSVTIPDSVTTLANFSFSHCANLASITIGKGVSYFSSLTLRGCPNLTGIWVDSENTVYSSDEFGVLFDKDKTTLLCVPETIDAYTIPESVINIADFAFEDCVQLKTIIIPDNVTYIGWKTFARCTSLTTVTIGEGLTRIDAAAFSHCDSLISVVIPENVRVIGREAFWHCDNLTTITLPNSLERIEECAFRECISLKYVYYDGTPCQWGQILIDDWNGSVKHALTCLAQQQARIVSHPKSSGGTVGEKVRFVVKASGVASYLWQYRADSNSTWYPTSMEGYNTDTLTVPVNARRNGYQYRCVLEAADGSVLYTDPATLLLDMDIITHPRDQRAILGDTVLFRVKATDVAAYRWQYRRNSEDSWHDTSFSGCDTATLSMTATSGRNGYQYRCRLTDDQGLRAFTAAATLTVYEEIACGTGDDYDWTLDSDGKLTVFRAGSAGVINSEAPWYPYRGQIESVEIAEGITSIGKYAFYSYYALRDIHLPDSLVNIGYCSFEECYSLETIVLPDGVCSIDDFAFAFSYSLQHISIPDSVIELGQGAFMASGLKQVDIGIGIKEILQSTFLSCRSLQTVYYSGTSSQWETIDIDEENNSLLAAVRYTHTPISLCIERLPDKLSYALGEPLDLSGLVLIISYEDGVINRITDNYSVAGFDSYLEGNQVLTVSYEGLDVAVPVAISKGQVWITSQPKDRCVGYNETAVIAVEATNVVSYQWQYRRNDGSNWNTTKLSGYNTAQLSVVMKTGRVGFQYRCMLTGEDGTVVYSEPATLTMDAKLEIVTSPSDCTALEGSFAPFTVEATDVLSYRWYYRRNADDSWHATSMKGYVTNTLQVLTTPNRDGYQYRCKLTGIDGTVNYTEPATLTVNPVILTQPTNIVGAVGGTASFHAEVQNVSAIQWLYRRTSADTWAPTGLDGNKTNTLNVGVTAGRAGYQYMAKLTNNDGSILYTKEVTLFLAPSVTQQPADQTVAVGENAVFTVVASNVVSYQWQYSRDGVKWSNTSADGNKTATLSVTTKATNNGYRYRCVLTGAEGFVTYTDAATLTVE